MGASLRARALMHLGSFLGLDLCGALHAALRGDPQVETRHTPVDCPVALFPQELARDPSRRSLNGWIHDVSFDDPDLLIALESHFHLQPLPRNEEMRIAS